jgi:dTDP-4-dehydrorhamnose 3,5-epimerase
MPDPRVTPTEIDGLQLVDLVVHRDERGSFREAFQAEKLAAAGLRPFRPVQWNVAENTRRAVLRGIHAEPWDKFVHVLRGEVFAAIADLRRDSPTFRRVCTYELDPSKALFLSRGLGNSYQVLSDGALYGYLTGAHWQPGVPYLGVAWNDPELAIRWPLPVGPEELSAKDRALPFLRQALGERAAGE